LIDYNLIEKTLERSHSSSSLESFHSQQQEDHLNIYTSLLAVEHLLQELSTKGEENLAGQLANFYRASYQTSFPLEDSPLSHSSSVEDLKKKLSFSPPLIVMPAPPPPLTKMQQILAARYAPLILPNPVAAMPTGDYQKYMPKFTGEGDVSVEEHIEAFYSYAENLNIEQEDVWTRVFVQSLDGHARKWFKELPAGSIAGIEHLDETFLKHWGDRRDFVYYITEFGNLRKQSNESVSDFTKRFNRMYGKIPAEIKPSDASAKITYSDTFDSDFCLLLRERRSPTLSLMQDAALEVESNILASQKRKGDSDRRRPKNEASSSSNADPKLDKMAKMLESLTSEISKLKIENKKPVRGRNTYDSAGRNPNLNPNNFRRNNQPTQILQRENNSNEDQRIKVPFQNVVMDEDNGDDQEDGEGDIHCVGEETGKSYLTQQDYEQSLMTEQTEDDLLGDGIFTTEDKNRYNLRSKSNAAQQDAPASSEKPAVPVKQKNQTSQDQTSEDQQANPPKVKASAPPKKTAAPVKCPTPESQPPIEKQKDQETPSNQVKVSDKAADKVSYSFNFEAEIQKIKIPIPLVELMKNEMFKRDILKTLDPQSVSPSADILNIYDDKPTITLGQMVEDRDESCPPFYISLNIHEKTLHNCLLDSGASHNLMPKAVMDELGLEITKSSHDLFSFDSRKVKCLGMIKDLADLDPSINENYGDGYSGG
jgi:hypothetical protein